MRWGRFKNNDPRQIFDVISQRVFPAINNLKGGKLPAFDENENILEVKVEEGQTNDRTRHLPGI